MTLQDVYIERLALQGDRISVTRPYSDGSVEVTQEHGPTILVHVDGKTEDRPHNQSINWSE